VNLATTVPCRGTLAADLGNVTLRVVYSDESEPKRIVVVAALIMNLDRIWPLIFPLLTKIKADTPAILLSKQGELKGSILYPAIKKVRQPRASVQLLSDLEQLKQAESILNRLLAIPRNYSIPIYYGATDKDGYQRYAITLPKISGQEQATPHDIAFTTCLTRVNAFATQELADNEQVLWIHDQRGREGEKQTITGLKWTRFATRRGWDPVACEAVETPTSVRITDAIHFGYSHESLALQLADVCCYTITQQLLERFYDWDPFIGKFYEIIQPIVMNDGVPPLHKELI
jgi:hypothetical protein